jgi:hypothetical protein
LATLEIFRLQLLGFKEECDLFFSIAINN